MSGLTRAGTPGSGYGGIYICSGLRRGTSEAETAACRKPGERKLAEGDRWLWPRRRRGRTASWPARSAIRSAEKRRAEGVPSFAEAAACVVEVGSGGGAVLLGSGARGRAARLSVERSGLGGRGDGSSSRGGRDGAGTQDPQPGRAGPARVETRRPVRSDDPPRSQRRSMASRQGYLEGSDPPPPGGGSLPGRFGAARFAAPTGQHQPSPQPPT